MAKKFRAIKTTLILMILIVSIFTALTFSASARIFKIDPIITISPGRAENVIPRSGVLDIDVTVAVSLSGFGASFVSGDRSVIKDSAIAIQLSATTAHDWIQATIVNSLLEVRVGDVGSERAILHTRVQLTVTEKAPAFTMGEVIITAKTNRIPGIGFVIEEKTYIETVPFEIGYWGVVSISSPKGNFIEIGPLDSAVFPIDIINLGNAVTRILIEPIGDIPEGWVVSVPATDIIPSDDVAGSQGARTRVYLTIKPPFDFGIHNQRQSFKVSFITHYIGQPHLRGESQTELFTVQSVGFSPGIGYEIPMIAIFLFILFIAIYNFYYRKHGNTKEKKEKKKEKLKKLNEDLKPEKKEKTANLEAKEKPEKKEKIVKLETKEKPKEKKILKNKAKKRKK